MKQTKTRRFLLVVTLMLLVLTLGLGLFFMQPKSASAEEAAELVPLADAELHNTAAFKIGDGGVSHGVFWDANHSQMRLFYKVTGGTPTRLSKAPENHYRNVELIEFTAGGKTKSIKDWTEIAWADNMGANNGDASVGEIWINSTNRAWFDSITEVHYKVGFAEKDDTGADTDVKTTKDYYLWNGGDLGWLTRADKEKGFTVEYKGGNIAWGGSIDESKLEVKATPKGSETAVKIDQGCYTISDFNSFKAGQQTVKVKYQDLEEKTFTVTVQEDANAANGIEVVTDNTPATDWMGVAGNSTQLLFYFKMKGDVTAPTRLVPSNVDTTALHNGNRIQDYLLINGKDASDWRSHVAWMGWHFARPENSAEDVYELWLCVNEDGARPEFTAAEKAWKAAIQTVTFKAGFQLSANSALLPDLILKEDVTLWNAHDAGWQRAVSEITAKTAGDVSLQGEVGQQLSAEELAKLTVTGKFIDGSEDKTIDNSKVSIALPETAGEGQATITYQGKTAKVNVNMTASKTLKSIEVTNKNYSAERWTYPAFNDLEVKAHFEDEEDGGTVLSRGDYTVSGYDMWAAGDTTEATVTYSYGGTEQTATFTINLTDYAGATSMKIGTDALLNFEWGGYSFVQFGSVRFEGFTSYSDTGLVTAPFNQDRNIMYADLTVGAHVGDYIELTIGGETKTATQWIAQVDSGVLGVVTFNSGNWMIQVTGSFDKSTVTLVTFKAGLEWVTADAAPAFPCEKAQAPVAQYHTVPGAVLTKDVVLYNGGTTWVKAVKELTASYTGTVLQNGNLNRDSLTVNATYYGEEQPTKLGNNDYTVDFSSAEVGDAVQGTVTYRGKTATFTVKVEAPTKTLDRIEVSGTTKFSAARFGTAPALTGLVVKAYFVDEEEGEVLQAGEGGYTVGAMDMWAAEGDHKITVSYTYGTTTKTAEITLEIIAPDSSINFDFVEGGSFNGYIETCEWGTTGQGKNGTRFFWQSRYCLSFPITYTGVAEDYPKNVNAIHFEWVTGIHLGEYVKLTYNGQVKTLAELLEGDTPVVRTVGISDNGQFIICFTNADDCMKVTDVTFLTGMQIPKVTNQGLAWEFGATKEELNRSVELVPGLVLQHDVCLWNADAAGWQLHADSIEATVKAGSKFTAGTADIKSLLEVKAVYGSEKKAITNFTITNYNKDTVGKQNITITYQDRTATLEITVEAAPVTKYDVTFALGDHAASDATAPPKQTADKDAQITLPAAPKAANGYEFDGWYDGTTKAGDANAKYTVTKTVTLTAHWKQVAQPAQKVTVTFNLNGATGTAPASQTIDKGAKATKPATDPVREGYTFGGWYTDANCTTEFDFNGAVNADTTVYAKWTKNTTPDTPVDPDKPADPDKPDDKGEADNGCGSVIGGVGVVLAVMVTLGTALAVIFVKRKKND